MLTRRTFNGIVTATPFFGSGISRETWQQYDQEPLIYDGVAVCIYVDGNGVVLIPEDENESDKWPVDVLRVTMESQHRTLAQLREGLNANIHR